MDLVVCNVNFLWGFNKSFTKKKVMKKKLLPIFISLIFVVFFIIFYKGLKVTNIYIPEARVKNEIPIFNTKFFRSNNKINSSNIFESDKFYLLNIWSSWCVPCRKEHPFLMSLIENDKLTIIGMNYKDNKSNAENFLKELGNPYNEIFVDIDGTIAIEWGAYGIPESFLIYNSKIIKKYIGPLNKKLINEMEILIK